jgi:glycosyltransferase involved in cell wall biosynthesis
VSVAVASYNYGRYLEDCVRSALDQPGVDLEVVIVDDASSDDSVEVAQRLAAEDSRVRLLVHEKNHGHISTFNEALWQATGEFVVKLDSDDMLTPGSLARSARVLAAHPRVGLVYGHPLTFEITPPPSSSLVKAVRVWRGDRWLTLRCRRATNVIMQPEAMVRASVLHMTGGHRASCPATHDLNLWLRIAAISDVARIHGADQGYYRVHQDSLLRSRFGSYLSDLQQRRLAFDDFYETASPSTAARLQMGELRIRTARTLSRQARAHAARLARIGVQEAEDVHAYIAFADDVCPDGRGGRGSRLLVGRAGQATAAQRAWDRWCEASQVMEELRWRRWRRFGT